MKAKEWLKEYKQLNIVNEKQLYDFMVKLVSQLLLDSADIMQHRKVRQLDGIINVVKDVNQKYVSVVKGINDHEGKEIFKTDGFINYFIKKNITENKTALGALPEYQKDYLIGSLKELVF